MIKKILTASVILILIFSVLTAGCISKTYYVGVDSDVTAPFVMVDSDTGEFYGFDVDSMRWIANYENMNVEFTEMDWNNIIPSLQAGEIDLIYSDLSVSDERKELVTFSDPYLTIKIAVAANKNADVTWEEFISGNTIVGVPSGTTSEGYVEILCGENYERMVSDGKIMAYDTLEEMCDDLEIGKITTAVFEERSIDDAVKNYQNIYMLHATNISEDVAIAVRKENTELLDKLNHGLDALMATDYWTELKTKYEIA